MSGLIISDLNYLHHLPNSISVVGGLVYADASTTAATNDKYAISAGVATAIGQISYTNVDTKTTVKNFGNSYLSTAYTNAKAYAKTGREIAVASSDSLSIAFAVDNW